MKSFNKFLQESSNISEQEARQGSLLTKDGRAQNFTRGRTPFTATDPTPLPASKRLPAGSSETPKGSSPGQLEIPEPKTTKVSSKKFRNAGEARQGSLLTKDGRAQNFTRGRTPFVGTEPVKATKRLSAAKPEVPKTSPGQTEIDFNARPNKGNALAKRPVSTPSAPVGTRSNPERIYPTPTKTSAVSSGQKALPSSNTTSSKQKALPSSSAKPSTSSTGKPPGKFAKIGKFAGPGFAALDTALSTADERGKGSGWARSIAKGATVAAGGLAGGALGAIGGGGIGSAALGTAGAMAGSAAAEKAFDTVAGANAKERKAMSTANRKRQSGSAIAGIGGKTTFDTKKNTMTTGSGAQRKTVNLAKTGVVQRGGKSTAGYLAYKGGKAVYKAAPSAQTLAKTSSNPLERVGRSLFAGAYKKHDAAKAQQSLNKARQNDERRNKALGVKSKPAG